MSVIDLFKANIGKPMTDAPSAVSNWLNGTLLEVEVGKLKVEYRVRENMTNVMKTLHGGVLSMIHDDLIGMTVFTLERDAPYTSLNLTVDFLKSTNIGETIIAESEVVRPGRKVVYVHSTIYKLKDEQKVLVSKATSNMLRFE